MQHQLVLAALNIAVRLLCVNGAFVAKIFRGKDVNLVLRQIKLLFTDVWIAKPKCSRNSSIEGFVVGKGFKGREAVGLKSDQLNLWDALTTLNHLKNFASIYYDEEEEKEEDIVPFVACGLLEELDADMNYSLKTKLVGESDTGLGSETESGAYNYLEPRQKPIDPPYKAFMGKRNEINNCQ